MAKDPCRAKGESSGRRVFPAVSSTVCHCGAVLAGMLGGCMGVFWWAGVFLGSAEHGGGAVTWDVVLLGCTGVAGVLGVY